MFKDVTKEVTGTALPSLLLYAARQADPAFADVPLARCRVQCSEASPTGSVFLRILDSNRLAAEAEHIGQATRRSRDETPQHEIGLDLCAAPYSQWIHDQPVGTAQLKVLRDITGVSLPERNVFDPVEEILIDQAPLNELASLLERTGRRRILGNFRDTENSSCYMDLFCAKGDFNLTLFGFGEASKDNVRYPRHSRAMQGYILQLDGVETPLAFHGMHARQAEYLYEKIVAHIQDLGVSDTLSYLDRIISWAYEEPRLWMGRALSQPCKQAPLLPSSLSELARRLVRTGNLESVGYLPSADNDGFHFHDILYWRGGVRNGGSHEKERQGSVVMRAVSKRCSQTFEPAERPDDITGYILDIRSGDFVLDLDDLPRETAKRCFTAVRHRYLAHGFDAAVLKAQDFLRGL